MSAIGLLSRYGLSRPSGGGGGGSWGACDNYGLATYTPGNGNESEQRGWRFTVGASDVRVCALRHQSRSTAVSQTLRLWRVSDGALLAAKTYTPSVTSSWEEIPLDTPIVLEAGQTYIVSGRTADGTNKGYRYAFEPIGVHAAVAYGDAVTSASNAMPTTGSGWIRLVDIVFAELE